MPSRQLRRSVIRRLRRHIDRLETENRRLRALVADLQPPF